MKYIVCDQTKTALYTEEYPTLSAALDAAENQWHHLTAYDRRQRVGFYVLESINPDEDAPDHFDGDYIKCYK